MDNKISCEAGSAIYNKLVLSVYDWWVLGFSNSFLWRCPTRLLEAEFARNATKNHLDVGVGTGYYLHKCFDNNTRRLALLDINPNSLFTTASRIQKYNPEIYQTNILLVSDLHCESFDSISLFYLLHCLPGTLSAKSIVFKNLIPYLNEGGVIFGSTILGKGVRIGYFAEKLMAIYNEKGIFDNYNDCPYTLEDSLNKFFKTVEIKVIGCVAIFKCNIPIS